MLQSSACDSVHQNAVGASGASLAAAEVGASLAAAEAGGERSSRASSSSSLVDCSAVVDHSVVTFGFEQTHEALSALIITSNPASESKPQAAQAGPWRRRATRERRPVQQATLPTTPAEVAQYLRAQKLQELNVAKGLVAFLSLLLSKQKAAGSAPKFGAKSADFCAILILFVVASVPTVAIFEKLYSSGDQLTATQKLMTVGGFALLTALSLFCKAAAPILQKGILSLRHSPDAKYFYSVWSEREEQRKIANTIKSEIARGEKLGLISIQKIAQDATSDLIRPAWSMMQAGISLAITYWSIANFPEKAALRSGGVLAFLVIAVGIEKYLVQGISGLIALVARCCSKNRTVSIPEDRNNLVNQLHSKLSRQTTFLDTTSLHFELKLLLCSVDFILKWVYENKKINVDHADLLRYLDPAIDECLKRHGSTPADSGVGVTGQRERLFRRRSGADAPSPKRPGTPTASVYVV